MRTGGLRTTGLAWAAGRGWVLVSLIRKRQLSLVVMQVAHCMTTEVTILSTTCTASHSDLDEANQR